MLYLDETLFIGEGGDKRCYRHPEDKSSCIKIAKNSHGLKVILKDLKGREKLKRKQVDLAYIPCYLGTVGTNLGLGYVYEIITDTDGEISRSLDWYLRLADLDAGDVEMIVQAMGRVKDSVFKNEVILKDPKRANFLLQKTETGYEAKYVDDLGSEVLIPLEYYISYLARLKIRRKWDKLIIDIKRFHTGLLAKRFIEELK